MSILEDRINAFAPITTMTLKIATVEDPNTGTTVLFTPIAGQDVKIKEGTQSEIKDFIAENFAVLEQGNDYTLVEEIITVIEETHSAASQSHRFIDNKVFQVCLTGYDSSTDTTDHLVKWISCPKSKIKKALQTLKWENLECDEIGDHSEYEGVLDLTFHKDFFHGINNEP